MPFAVPVAWRGHKDYVRDSCCCFTDISGVPLTWKRYIIAERPYVT
jgi:hypothetical protein